MSPSKSKNIVITGGAQGIGRALARHLLLSGHRVFILDIDEAELTYAAEVHLPTALRSTSSRSGQVDPTTPPLESPIGYRICNLRNVAAVRAAIDAAADFFGGHIDVLINNAGIARAQWRADKAMDDPSTLEEWTAYMETNLTAPFIVSQACIPYMKAKESGVARGDIMEAVLSPGVGEHAPPCKEPERPSGGSIINISSFRALQSQPNCEGYASSKAGMLGLTHAMAVSGAQWGIRCNAILPGFIYVMHENKAGDESDAEWCKDIEEARHRHHLVGRIGCARDVAETVEWLMGAGFTSGAEIVLDGGISKIKHTAA